MKRILLGIGHVRIFFIIPVILLVSFLSGCSYLSKRQGISDSTDKNETVAKAQYDDLLRKYQNLVRERSSVGAPAVSEAAAEKPPGDIVADLAKINKNADLVETVDAFGKDGLVSGNKQTSIAKEKEEETKFEQPEGDEAIENQIVSIRKAIPLVSENKFDTALGILKPLEKSSIKQVRVWSKYLIGEILFKQGEFDLAMQVFEEIITKNAFSGLVIKSLGHLIVCSEKLKLNKKREQYFSLLHDFFEAT
ncbi:MAG: hypothetical protein WCG27_08245 [Pseudomonadota bacterium]